MNQGSLLNYKQQVYNPCSPNPNPSLSPLKCLPRTDPHFQYNSVTINPDNPLKLTIGSASKRKLSGDLDSSQETDTSPSKRMKMMSPEEVEKMNQSLMQKFQESQNAANQSLLLQITSKLDKHTEENSSIKTEIGQIADKLDTLTQSQIQEKKTIDDRFKALENKYEELNNRLLQSTASTDNVTIEEAVRNYVDNSNEGTWKANLSREVFEHEHGLVIHGFRLLGLSDQEKKESAMKFLREELKASSDLLSKIRIREVTRLGSDTGLGKPPPVLMKFGHPTERNQLLPLSSNLKKGIDIDKSVPKKYQSKHKEFKRRAWKLKLVYGVQTQVIFNEYNLILRYKRRDEGVNKYNFIVEDEWFPNPGDVENTRAGTFAVDPAKINNLVIDVSSVAECHKMSIITGVPTSVTVDNASNEIMSVFLSKDHRLICRIEFKVKGTVIVVCKDWNSCKHITNTYQKSKFQGHELNFSMFSEKEPSTE